MGKLLVADQRANNKLNFSSISAVKYKFCKEHTLSSRDKYTKLEVKVVFSKNLSKII